MSSIIRVHVSLMLMKGILTFLCEIRRRTEYDDWIMDIASVFDLRLKAIFPIFFYSPYGAYTISLRMITHQPEIVLSNDE